MDPEIRALKSFIKSWKKTARDAERMVEHYEAALKLREVVGLRQKAEAAEPRKAHPARVPPPSPFTAKYTKSAKEFIMETLPSPGSGRGLSQPEIQAALKARNLRYSNQAVAFALKRLEALGRVKRKRAPNGSSAHFIYEAVKVETDERRAAH
jgi:hypothetical protein